MELPEGFPLRKVLIITASLAAAGVLLFYVFTLPTQQKTQKQVIALSHPAKGITLVASVDSNRLTPGKAQTLHLELLRETATLPAALNVCAQLPGTQPVCKPWPTPYWQFAPRTDLQVHPMAGALSQKMTVRVTASGWPRNATAASQTFQESILSVGPFVVERSSDASDRLLRGLARLRGLLKDLTLPILIPLVGIYFARRASHRAEEDEVRRMLLTKVQGLTKNFYIHVVFHARNSITFLKDKGASNEANFHLLSMLLYNSQMKEQEGAVFFTNLEAEKIYQGTIYLILEEVRSQMAGEGPYRAALDALRTMRPAAPPSASPSGNPATGAGSITPPPQFLPPRLAEYLASPPTTVLLAPKPFFLSALDFLKTVTSYELDAPLYEHWYKEPGKLEFQAAAEELALPKRADLQTMTPRQQEAWCSVIGNARLWLKGKPGANAYLNVLPDLKKFCDSL